MDEALELKVGSAVLEIGSGSGWHAATIAEVVAPAEVPLEEQGHVYTLERLPELAEFATKNIERAGYGDRITVVCGDGSVGYPEKAPYDRVLVTAVAPKIPKPLIHQLKRGGVLVIPVGGLHFYQTLVRIRKEGETLLEENLGGVAFVPLIGKHGFKG